MPNELAILDRAEAALAKARTFEQVKKIRDMAEAARSYAIRAHKARDVQCRAAELALQAARKAGQILKQLQKTPPKSAAKVAGDSEYRKALRDTKTPERTARHWQRLADITEYVLQHYCGNVRKAEKGDITAAGLLREATKLGRVVAAFRPADDPDRVKKEMLEQGVSEGLPLEALVRIAEVGGLTIRFGAPPFSVLDLRRGYWTERQRAWEKYGINGEAGRGDEHEAVHSDGILHFDSSTNISVFNAPLTETVYQWFAPKGGHILDPFAGGATRGVVAQMLGYKYTGIELRSEQVEENRKQARKVRDHPVWLSGGLPETANWICGDSAQLSAYVAGQEFDLIFTCPPYYDLERYTKADERDLSRCKTYEDFVARYEDIFRQAIAHLKQDRFAVVVVGEIRDKKGWYRNFVGDTVSCFQRLGLHYYNEIILLDPIGSAPLRVGKPFSQYRKVQKAHQTVLVFWRGNNAKRIPEALGVLDEVKFVAKNE